MHQTKARFCGRVGLRAYPPTHNSQGIRPYMFLRAGKARIHARLCFRRRIFAMLLLKFSVKAALWRSLARPARISGPYQGTGAETRAPSGTGSLRVAAEEGSSPGCGTESGTTTGPELHWQVGVPDPAGWWERNQQKAALACIVRFRVVREMTGTRADSTSAWLEN